MYRVEAVGDDIEASIDALPPEFLAAFRELETSLGGAPWSVGRPYNATTPRGSRTATFGPNGRGLVLFAINDRDLVVVVWQVAVAPDVTA